MRHQRNYQSLRKYCFVLLILSSASVLRAQSDTSDLNALDADVIVPALKNEILSPAVAEFQIRQYLVNQVAAAPKAPSTPQEWTAEASKLRHHLLFTLK